MQNPEAVVVVPAYNEAAYIEKVLSDLARIRTENPKLVKKIIVVDDGSKDRTAKIAAKYADKVIRFRRNKGKARAVFEGMKLCYERGEKVMIMLDADLKAVSAQQLRNLVERLGQKSGRYYQIQMAVGGVKGDSANLSGERAFLVESFKPLMLRKDLQQRLLGKGKQRGGYGLEIFLNWLYTGKRQLSDPAIRARRAEFAPVEFEAAPITSEARIGRTEKDIARVCSEPDAMAELLRERERRAKFLRAQRENKRFLDAIRGMRKRPRK